MKGKYPERQVTTITGGVRFSSPDEEPGRLLPSVSRNPSHVCRMRSNPMETPTMASRRVTDEDGRVWECSSESAEAPGRDVNLVCTTAGLRAPLRVKVTWQWARMAEKGLARIIAAAAPRLAAG